jgi:hypothetical protein
MTRYGHPVDHHANEVGPGVKDQPLLRHRSPVTALQIKSAI